MDRAARRAFNQAKRRARRIAAQPVRPVVDPPGFVATWDENGLIDKSIELPPQRGIIVDSDQFDSVETALNFLHSWISEQRN